MVDKMDGKPVRKSTLPEWAKSGPSAKAPSPRAEREYCFTVGMLGLAAGAALVFALIAFGAGWQVAKKMTTAQLEAKHKAELDRITKAMMATQAGGGGGSALPNSAQVVAPAGAPGQPPAGAPAKTGEPREAGLNYLRLCQVPEAEAEKYAGFLLTEGHRTWRVPSSRGGTPMITLYAVDRGFRMKDHAERVELEKYRAGLLALGDKWAKKNKGGNPFKSAYPEKYGT